MGQQQLLLLVLGIVIVGIAVVAGIQAFGEGKAKAQQDAAMSDAMRIISDVQAWKLKPTAFGGGDDGTVSFAKVSFAALGLDPAGDAGSDAAKYETISGCLELVGTTTGATLKVSKPGCTAQIATAEVTGTTSQAISWSYGAAATTPQ